MDIASGSGQLRFLVVDDLGVGRSVLGAMLGRFGEVETADSGARALEVYEEAVRDGKGFDLGLLDVMMPGMDGLMLLAKMREFERERGLPEMTVVMTSAIDQSEYVYAAREAGASGYLIKPLDLSKLVAVLQRLELVGEGP